MLLLKAIFCAIVTSTPLPTWPCAMKTKSYADCQTICNISSSCAVWTWVEKDQQCWFMHREGWVARDAAGYFTGLKNQEIVAENFDAAGGNVMCVNDR